jgi:hypothetical protein
MGNGHIRPRDVSGESCLTVTNTLVSYMLTMLLKVTVLTCSDVTTIDVSDVQQMSQMPDLSEA